MDAEGLEALFEPFGSVSVKRKFGGDSVYAEGLCFAIKHSGGVFLKVDAQAASNSQPGGSQTFSGGSGSPRGA